MGIDNQIEELRSKIEAMGIKGIVFQDGIFRVVPAEESPNQPHQQMFHIHIREIPA